MARLQRISPCLWFDDQAEAAAAFYTSVFPNSRIGTVLRYTEAGVEHHGKPAGSVMTVDFELDGQPFTALNGGPLFEFNEAISFQVVCQTQEELDFFWERLQEGGGRPQPCGWLKDRFGVSWQIVPETMPELLADAGRRERVMNAMFGMHKIDLAALQAAANAESAA